MSATIGTTSSQTSSYQPPTSSQAGTTERIRSIDIIRGVIMVLMAIDHVRVYSGIPAGGATAGIFFTRWVTHFCAPGFVFLAGTAAFLHGRTLGDAAQLSRFLLTRGVMLVVLELTLIRFSWTFNFAYDQFTLAGVIWMLGWCMILLAALVRLRPRTVGWLGGAIVCFQQAFALVPNVIPAGARGGFGRIWEFVYPAGLDGTPGIAVLYVIVPWIGVMAVGYGFGALMVREPATRDPLSLRIGLGMTAAFIAAATALVLLQDPGDDTRPALFRMLDQQKYPASQLFLLMTLGPMIALLPAADRWRGSVANAFDVIGRVPMFYYLLHIPLIHVSALIVNTLRTGAAHGEWYDSAPFAQVPPEQRWTLAMLFAAFAVNVALLYCACRWYANIKRTKRAAWMRYV
ncbi:MAG TPA: heparan-alpha-glucosaminide N-acetyltransferase domain-containing protein [Gemmatimonadaceae bacterium]|nr:heparan-alpha-glucosaminide N-acetyltransferase domain-containing protein [Gemmatimonadaceae bacterium]